MFFVLVAFGAPFLYAIDCIIESFLSNRSFKHQMTMIFYISLMNAVLFGCCVFVPLLYGHESY